VADPDLGLPIAAGALAIPLAAEETEAVTVATLLPAVAMMIGSAMAGGGTTTANVALPAAVVEVPVLPIASPILRDGSSTIPTCPPAVSEFSVEHSSWEA
jgi:hypothetical protein